jgi:hypothetical protein
MVGKVLKVSGILVLAAIVPLVVWRMITTPFEVRRQLEAADTITLTNWSEQWPAQNYTIDIHRNGEIVFTGGPKVLLPGEHRLMVSPEKADALFARFEGSSFLGMKALYKGWLKPTDGQKLCLRGGGFEHCVEAASSPMFGNNAPSELGDLMGAVYTFMPPERWIRAGPGTIEVFREEGLDPRSIGGQHLVFEVAKYFDLAAMRALIDGGFPVDAVREDPDFHLETPVEVAAYNGRVEIMRALIEAGAWKSATPVIQQRTLRAAARSCQPEVVQAVFDEGAVLVPRAMPLDTLLCRDGLPQTADPLATAALMLKHGLPVDVRDAYGHTALHFRLDPDVARLLLRNGADPNTTDALGVPPLLTTSDENLAIALIEAGADVDATHDRSSAPGERSSGESIDTIAAAGGWTRVQALVNARRAEARAKAR